MSLRREQQPAGYTGPQFTVFIKILVFEGT